MSIYDLTAKDLTNLWYVGVSLGNNRSRRFYESGRLRTDTVQVGGDWEHYYYDESGRISYGGLAFSTYYTGIVWDKGVKQKFGYEL